MSVSQDDNLHETILAGRLFSLARRLCYLAGQLTAIVPK
jgi:hypothetical protein